MHLIKIFVSVVMNTKNIGREINYDTKDFFFSDSHILTVSIISIFAVILAVLGVCFFFKICEYDRVFFLRQQLHQKFLCSNEDKVD